MFVCFILLYFIYIYESHVCCSYNFVSCQALHITNIHFIHNIWVIMLRLEVSINRLFLQRNVRNKLHFQARHTLSVSDAWGIGKLN